MQPLSKNKVLLINDLTTQIERWKVEEYLIIFTNGCFDVLHAGHVDYLEKAKQFGGKLVLGLNTDQSIKKNKGESRPINDAFARSKVLSALSSIDAIVFFDEETPYNLIRQIEPNILVKGSDYRIENIVGADFVLEKGGEVRTIELLEGYSTTNIIKKIKNIEL